MLATAAITNSEMPRASDLLFFLTVTCSDTPRVSDFFCGIRTYARVHAS